VREEGREERGGKKVREDAEAKRRGGRNERDRMEEGRGEDKNYFTQ